MCVLALYVPTRKPDPRGKSAFQRHGRRDRDLNKHNLSFEIQTSRSFSIARVIGAALQADSSEPGRRRVDAAGRLSFPRFRPPARHRYVNRFTLWVCLLSVAAASSAGPDLAALLKGVEGRYNRARTLQVHFEQTYQAPQRPPKTESGELFLRKPGRMQWRYSQPPGKLFIGDGKYVYLYTPSDNRVERTRMKESDDMRAPLAFLLGKLDFERDFKRFTTRPADGGTWIAAEPRSAKVPFANVEFLVNPSYEIRELIVAQDGGSVMHFRFDQEQLNPTLAESLFRFQAPPGAEVVEDE